MLCFDEHPVCMGEKETEITDKQQQQQHKKSLNLQAAVSVLCLGD